jgi:YHS domain-containing protein
VVRWILLFILLLIIGRLFWRMVDGIIEAAGGTPRSQRAPTRRPAVRLVRDPVCGTHVAPGASLSLAADGTTHYFCSEKCRTEFTKRR